MMKISNQFTHLAAQLRDKELYSKIFDQQSLKFDLATYKLKNISCETMIKLY